MIPDGLELVLQAYNAKRRTKEAEREAQEAAQQAEIEKAEEERRVRRRYLFSNQLLDQAFFPPQCLLRECCRYYRKAFYTPGWSPWLLSCVKPL